MKMEKNCFKPDVNKTFLVSIADSKGKVTNLITDLFNIHAKQINNSLTVQFDFDFSLPLNKNYTIVVVATNDANSNHALCTGCLGFWFFTVSFSKAKLINNSPLIFEGSPQYFNKTIDGPFKDE